MLRKSGLEVFEAASGSAAIDLLRARGGEIEVILLDLTIPGNSSQEVVAEAALARPDVKVILTSAYAEEVAMRITNHPLVCGFIRKPFQARGSRADPKKRSVPLTNAINGQIHSKFGPRYPQVARSSS